eukprot:s2722_g11.t1
MATSERLTLERLVTLDQDVVPYVLDWPGADLDGASETMILVVGIRPGGFLAAVPVGFIPEEILAVGNTPSPPGMVGPSTAFSVPAVVLEQGALAPTGADVPVLVVDLSEAALEHLHRPSEQSPLPFAFDADQEYAFPSPEVFLGRIQEWIATGLEFSTLGFYSAESVDGEPLADGEIEAALREGEEEPPPRPRRRKPTVPGQEGPTLPAKKPTVASLAGSMEQLLNANLGMQKQLEALQNRQLQLESRSMQQNVMVPAHHAALRQPISSALTAPHVSSHTIAQQVGTPPRTAAPVSPGLLRSHMMKPPEVGELEAERFGIDQSSSRDPLAQAVLAQSNALTALVSQLASQSSDPMLELSSLGANAGTRGAQGRARLQMDLAAQKGVFFNSVLASMARRMFPTLPAEGSPQELMNRGICGTKYLERFGGFGRHRELGCLQHQVMVVLDFLQTENLAGARDAAALLAVTLDQAALDNGRFDLAFLLALQEEPPSTVFTHKPATMLSKARSFSPLADQKWVTVALAYIKELDVIQTKRAELTSKPATFASEAAPKPKPYPKKKGRGGKGGGQQQTEAEDQ